MGHNPNNKNFILGNYKPHTKPHNKIYHSYMPKSAENTSSQSITYIRRIEKQVSIELNPNEFQVPDRIYLIPTNQTEEAYNEVYMAIKNGEPQQALKEITATQFNGLLPTIDDLLYRIVVEKIKTNSDNPRLTPTFANAIELLAQQGKKIGYSDVSEERKSEVTKEVIRQRADGYKITLLDIAELLYREMYNSESK